MKSGESRWWVLSDAALVDLLDRAHSGEDPGLVMAEFYANSDHSPIETIGKEDIDD